MYGETSFVSYTVCVKHRLEKVVSSTGMQCCVTALRCGIIQESGLQISVLTINSSNSQLPSFKYLYKMHVHTSQISQPTTPHVAQKETTPMYQSEEMKKKLNTLQVITRKRNRKQDE